MAKLELCERVVRSQADHGSVAKVFLDFGCGVGRRGSIFHTRFDTSWNYVGVDPSQESICEARGSRDGSDKEAAVRYEIMDDWRVGEESYDFALAARVFHHIPSADKVGGASDGMEPDQAWGHVCNLGTQSVEPCKRRIVDACPFDKAATLLSLPEMKKDVGECSCKL